MDPIMQISNAIQQNLDSILGVPFMSSAVTLGLAFYAYKAAPELPSYVEELFLNVFFQVFIGFMVLYMATQNVMLSFIVSVVFIHGMKMLSKVKEGMFGGYDTESIIAYLNDAIAELNKAGYSEKAYDIEKQLGDIQSDMIENVYGPPGESYNELKYLKEEVQDFAKKKNIKKLMV